MSASIAAAKKSEAVKTSPTATKTSFTAAKKVSNNNKLSKSDETKELKPIKSEDISISDINTKHSDCLFNNIDNYDITSTKEETDLNMIEVQNEIDIKCPGIVSENIFDVKLL